MTAFDFMVWDLAEARRTIASYRRDRPGYADDHEPIRDDDIIRVFHGFSDPAGAMLAITRGLSGKDRVIRRYSYETNNNPRGLFVTPDPKAAKEFTGSLGPAVIIEFMAHASDLEAPVWPTGGYVGQGGKSGVFTSRLDRESGRKRQRELHRQSRHASVAQSDRPEMAAWMLQGGESQALFVGNLNPNQIKAVWVADPDERGYQRHTSRAEYRRLSPRKFLQQYKGVIEPAKAKHRRVFQPNDPFVPKTFLKRLAAELGFKRDVDDLTDALEGMLKKRPRREWSTELERYLWPKQIPKAMRWINSLLKESTDDPAWLVLTERYDEDGFHVVEGYFDIHYAADEGHDGLAENLRQIYELEYKLHKMRTSYPYQDAEEYFDLRLV